MSDTSSNGSFVSEHLENCLKEETEENKEYVNFSRRTSDNLELNEDHVVLSCGEDVYPNSQSVSDEEVDMVKLDNNDLNYDDYDEYEGETRERFKSIDSNTQYRESMEDSRENEMVGISDSEAEGSIVEFSREKEDKIVEKTDGINNDCELMASDRVINLDRSEFDREELEEGEIEDDDDEINQEVSSPPLMTSSLHSSIRPKSLLDETLTFESKLASFNAEPIRTIIQSREKEVCRFYLRGICKNGDACRFRHCAQTQLQRPRIQIVSTSSSSTLITGGGKVPIYYNNKSNLINIPPPIGPPVSLLSTVFAPPPSTSLLTRPPPPPPAAPLPPSSTESVAWVEGLKKARELSRRQKGGELSEANQLETLNDVSDVDRSSLSPPLASVSPNNIQTEDSIFVSSSNISKSLAFSQNRRLNPPRVVVEAVSVVSASSHNTKDLSSSSKQSLRGLKDKIKIGEGEDNDDAPAAYRLPHRRNSNIFNSDRKQNSEKIVRRSDDRRKTRSSSSSSSSESSSSSSSSSSSTGRAGRKMFKEKMLNRKKNRQTLAPSSVSSLNICKISEKSPQIISSSLPLDELVREISSSESDCEIKKKGGSSINSSNYDKMLMIKKDFLIKEESNPNSSNDDTNNYVDIKKKSKAVDKMTKSGRPHEIKREQLLRKLHNVEQAIERKKQLKREGNATGSVGEKRTKL